MTPEFEVLAERIEATRMLADAREISRDRATELAVQKVAANNHEFRDEMTLSRDFRSVVKGFMFGVKLTLGLISLAIAYLTLRAMH
jgi:hypothetical protein